jgi:hypothetical protein
METDPVEAINNIVGEDSDEKNSGSIFAVSKTMVSENATFVSTAIPA